MLTFACTTNIRYTRKYIYSTEFRDYQVTKYQIIFPDGALLCQAFDSAKEAQAELRRMHRTGRIVSYQTTEYVVLHHRYINRTGR